MYVLNSDRLYQCSAFLGFFCGKAALNTKAESRIVGGQAAAAGAWPWQVRLLIPVSGGAALCGGSLINTELWSHDLTCLQLYLHVCLFSTSTSGVIIVHENYNKQTQDNDVSLLKLASPVTFNDYISPVCLAEQGSNFPSGTTVWVTGFGTLSSGGSTASSLQEVSVPIVSNSQCSSSYSSLTSNMMCAGLTQGGKDSCQGDSGGPLVSKNNDTRWVQAGVVSFGDGCAKPNTPGVYARVSEYQTWISSRVSGTQPGFVSFVSGSSSISAAHFISTAVLPVLFSVFVLF
uniref:Peptidase S1 domain-containing protein n=1 Tax=Oryzias latipes TaxID=8090 RepID=A0A3P9J8S8_ORYLA